jgi:hypothetical protein
VGGTVDAKVVARAVKLKPRLARVYAAPGPVVAELAQSQF